MRGHPRHLCAALLLGMLVLLGSGCGSDSPPTAADPGIGTELESSGLLAVEISSLGVANLTSALMERDGWSQGQFPLVVSLQLTFDSIRAYPLCDGCEGDGWGQHGGDGDADYIEILFDPITVDVMELDAALTVLLGTADLPSNDYSHLSLHVAEAWAVTEDGTEMRVTIGGHGESDLKVIVPFAVRDSEVTEIILVIDLDRALREIPPGSGQLVLMPVFHGDAVPGGDGHHGDGHHGDHSGDCDDPDHDHGDGDDDNNGDHPHGGGHHG